MPATTARFRACSRPDLKTVLAHPNGAYRFAHGGQYEIAAASRMSASVERRLPPHYTIKAMSGIVMVGSNTKQAVLPATCYKSPDFRTS